MSILGGHAPSFDSLATGRVILDELSLRAQLQTSLGTAYTLERELGGGGMSRVFVAEETRLRRKLVVKVLMPELAAGVSGERFKREIEFAASLQQANIVPLIAAGETEGLPYYTMPFVDGLSLRARLERNGALPVGQAVGVLRDVARALAYAHERGVVHRDIKPENILLSGDAAVVMDFGIAKALSAARTQAPGGTLTQVGTSIGTPAYMAPEQAAGDPATDHRADLYALGCVAYEMLAGSAPFAGRPTHQLFAAHLNEVPVAVSATRPDAPRALGELVAQLLEKDPSRRPQSAREVLQALDGINTSAVSASALRSSRARMATIMAGLLSLMMVVYAAWRGSHTSADADAAIAAVAVLPFENVSGDTASNYFADGMTDELATALAKVSGLRVASRTSSYTFRKHEGLDVRAIAAKLGVGAIVEGTVRRVGTQLRLTAQLTRGSDGQSLWADGFTAEADSVLAVQARLTRAIVSAVTPALGGRASTVRAATATSPKTKDAAAYDLYLRGRYELNRRGTGVRRSIAFFEQALARDTGFADAWAGLAVAWALLPAYDGSTPATLTLDSARSAARRAIALDSLGWEPWAALGYSHLSASRFDSAEVALRHSSVLAPRQAIPHRWLGLLYAGVGDFGQAAAEQRIALDLDPLSAASSTLAKTLALKPSGRPEARALARRAVAFDPANVNAMTSTAIVLFLTGDYDESLRILRSISDESARDARVASAWIGDLTALGQRDSVIGLMRSYERAPQTLQNMTAVAISAAALGEWDRFFTLTDLVVARGGEIAFVFVDNIAPLLRPIINDPRLRVMAERAHRDYGQLVTEIRESVPIPSSVR